jgi:dihydrofolate reductase
MNIVLTRKPGLHSGWMRGTNDIETTISTGCRHSGEIFVIGKSDLYQVLLSRAEMKR